MVAAQALRTDLKCFRQVKLTDPDFVELREMARMHDELVEERTRLGNRLHAELNRYYPQILKLANTMHESWILDLLEAAPTPERARWLKRKRIERILRKNRISRVSVDDVWEGIKAEPLHVAPGTTEAAAMHVALLIPRVRLAREQECLVRKRMEAKLAALAEAPCEEGEHRDVEIVLSLPGVGTKVGAAMLGEAWQAVTERDYHTLRVLAGTAPVTKASGKSRRVTMRYARNRRFANAVYHWARVASQHDPYARTYYDRSRARGHTHARATRQLADRLLRVLTAMLRDGTLYELRQPKLVKTELQKAA
jgi:transposase